MRGWLSGTTSAEDISKWIGIHSGSWLILLHRLLGYGWTTSKDIGEWVKATSRLSLGSGL